MTKPRKAPEPGRSRAVASLTCQDRPGEVALTCKRCYRPLTITRRKGALLSEAVCSILAGGCGRSLEVGEATIRAGGEV